MAKTELFVRRQVGGAFAITNETMTTGNIYFVNSATGTNSVGYGVNPDFPFASLTYALTQVTASQGDRIFLMPGHAETIAAAGGCTCGTAGVTVIGLGVGTNRPTLTWTTATTATFTITAANFRLQNVRCTAAFDEVVSLFVVSAANCIFDTVDYFETATFQARQFLLTTAAADGLQVRNCTHYQATAAAAAQKWIELIGVDRPIIEDNKFFLTLADTATSSVINGNTTANTMCSIGRNVIHLTGYSAATVSAILLASGNTGVVFDNRIGTDVAANTTINDAPSCYSFNNLCTNAVDKSGIVDPVVDT